MLWKELFSRRCRALLLGESAARSTRQLGHALVLGCFRKAGPAPRLSPSCGFGVCFTPASVGLVCECAKLRMGLRLFKGKGSMSSQKAGSLAPQKQGLNVLLSFVTSPSFETSLSPNPVWGRNEFSVLSLLDSSDFCSFVNIPKSTWHCSSLSVAYL